MNRNAQVVVTSVAARWPGRVVEGGGGVNAAASSFACVAGLRKAGSRHGGGSGLRGWPSGWPLVGAGVCWPHWMTQQVVVVSPENDPPPWMS